jgi:hypothetical protein
VNNRPIIRIADDGRDNISLWERCRLIVEQGIKKYGDAGGLPISGTGRARKKKVAPKKPKSTLKKASQGLSKTKHRHDRNNSSSSGDSHG